MPYTADVIDELNLLARYTLDTTQEGIKVHSNAGKSIIDATQRLFDKGLISQHDGGYLTSLGREAAEHVHATLHLLKV